MPSEVLRRGHVLRRGACPRGRGHATEMLAPWANDLARRRAGPYKPRSLRGARMAPVRGKPHGSARSSPRYVSDQIYNFRGAGRPVARIPCSGPNAGNDGGSKPAGGRRRVCDQPRRAVDFLSPERCGAGCRQQWPGSGWRTECAPSSSRRACGSSVAVWPSAAVRSARSTGRGGRQYCSAAEQGAAGRHSARK